MTRKKIEYFCAGCMLILYFMISAYQSNKQAQVEAASRAVADALREERERKEDAIEEYIFANSVYGISRTSIYIADNNEVDISIYSSTFNEDNFQNAVNHLTEISKQAVNKPELTLHRISIEATGISGTTFFEWYTWGPNYTIGTIWDFRSKGTLYYKTSVSMHLITKVLSDPPNHMSSHPLQR